jgi:hypothetical protein
LVSLMKKSASDSGIGGRLTHCCISYMNSFPVISQFAQASTNV